MNINNGIEYRKWSEVQRMEWSTGMELKWTMEYWNWTSEMMLERVISK